MDNSQWKESIFPASYDFILPKNMTSTKENIKYEILGIIETYFFPKTEVHTIIYQSISFGFMNVFDEDACAQGFHSCSAYICMQYI